MRGSWGIMDSKYLVIFSPSGKRGSFSRGTTLLDAAKSLNLDLNSSCGGLGICGQCQIIPTLGEFAFSNKKIKSTTKNINPLSQTEKQYSAGVKKIKNGRRLSCCSKILGDLSIEVPTDSQMHLQVIRKNIDNQNIKKNPPKNPPIVLKLVNLNKIKNCSAELFGGDYLSLLHMVFKGLLDQWKITAVDCELAVLKKLSATLKTNDYMINVAVRGDKIIEIYDKTEINVFGCAVDIGSTTISCTLINYNNGEVVANIGTMNPQIKFGEDLMSRISYVMLNKGGDKKLSQAIKSAVSELIERAIIQYNNLSEQTNNLQKNKILEMVVVGNSVMHHLFLGIDPTPLGFAPFDLSVNQALLKTASELEITSIHPSANIYIPPLIAGHVGADAAAVVLSTKPYLATKQTLIVDVGTNAEIIFGNKDKLYACSSPTGPAFEGAQISSGVRASVGAIERVRIDFKTLNPKVKIIGVDEYLNDDCLDKTNVQKNPENIKIIGICGSGIIEAMATMYQAGIITADGVIDGQMQSKTNRLVKTGKTWSYVLHRGKCNLDDDILITQMDVRAVQLAKAALYASCKLLMDKCKKQPERIMLTGAFGSHIDVKYAMILGLLPDCDLTQVHAVENGAGMGAKEMLLSTRSRKKIELVAKNIEKVETAMEKNFQQYFVDAMAIPNKTDAFLNLRAKVMLPKTNSQNRAKSRGRRATSRRRKLK